MKRKKGGQGGEAELIEENDCRKRMTTGELGKSRQ